MARQFLQGGDRRGVMIETVRCQRTMWVGIDWVAISIEGEVELHIVQAQRPVFKTCPPACSGYPVQCQDISHNLHQFPHQSQVTHRCCGLFRSIPSACQS